MGMHRIYKVYDFYKREGKVAADSFFNGSPDKLSLLLMRDLKLTSCNFYDILDGVKFIGQYDKIVLINSRGAIFK